MGASQSLVPPPTPPGHAGPHPAVRRVELRVYSRAFDATLRQVAIRSLRGRPSELHSSWSPEGQTILAFLPLVVPEIARCTCRSLPFGPSLIVPGLAYPFALPFGIGVPH